MAKHPARSWTTSRDIRHTGAWLRPSNAGRSVLRSDNRIRHQLHARSGGAFRPWGQSRRMPSLRIFSRWRHTNLGQQKDGGRQVRQDYWTSANGWRVTSASKYNFPWQGQRRVGRRSEWRTAAGTVRSLAQIEWSTGRGRYSERCPRIQAHFLRQTISWPWVQLDWRATTAAAIGINRSNPALSLPGDLRSLAPSRASTCKTSWIDGSLF